ncbi:hypothetical protein E2P81_ATG12105 [Venturia nashicola]|nr:hypothetical protein E2P81_ATG12105 [Venturia nashicola]
MASHSHSHAPGHFHCLCLCLPASASASSASASSASAPAARRPIDNSHLRQDLRQESPPTRATSDKSHLRQKSPPTPPWPATNVQDPIIQSLNTGERRPDKPVLQKAVRKRRGQQPSPVWLGRTPG